MHGPKKITDMIIWGCHWIWFICVEAHNGLWIRPIGNVDTWINMWNHWTQWCYSKSPLSILRKLCSSSTGLGFWVARVAISYSFSLCFIFLFLCVLQIRVSAVLTNGAYLLNVDCDHYFNNSKCLKEAMCFMMDPALGRKTCYVQFPQRFDGIDLHDRYANRNIVFFDVCFTWRVINLQFFKAMKIAFLSHNC